MTRVWQFGTGEWEEREREDEKHGINKKEVYNVKQEQHSQEFLRGSK